MSKKLKHNCVFPLAVIGDLYNRLPSMLGLQTGVISLEIKSIEII